MDSREVAYALEDAIRKVLHEHGISERFRIYKWRMNRDPNNSWYSLDISGQFFVEMLSKNAPTSNTVPVRNGHDGHEVIDNEAGGKQFKYCRTCKVEV